MDGLNVTNEKKGQFNIIKCIGFIDSETSKEMENLLNDLISKQEYKIIVDLSKVDYISSAGWGIFVGYVKDLRKNGGDIKFVGMKNEVRDIFEILDFTNILEYYHDVESAVKAFK